MFVSWALGRQRMWRVKPISTLYPSIVSRTLKPTTLRPTQGKPCSVVFPQIVSHSRPYLGDSIGCMRESVAVYRRRICEGEIDNESYFLIFQFLGMSEINLASSISCRAGRQRPDSAGLRPHFSSTFVTLSCAVDSGILGSILPLLQGKSIFRA